MQQTLIDIVMKPECMKEKWLGNTEKPAEYLVVCECVHECVRVDRKQTDFNLPF